MRGRVFSVLLTGKATAFQGETATSGGFMDGALGAQEIPLEAGDALM